ncbi:hypothetical protein AB0O76_07175 [Streptomyces sp. NPDC086554]|uniref:hypothetical protein n=1 Tax=Streptomyces sp. NPDC086554 TaxID=3154864 RepID=UPI00341E9528
MSDMLWLVIPGSGLNDGAAIPFVLGGGWANAAEDCCGSHGGYGQELADAHVGRSPFERGTLDRPISSSIVKLMPNAPIRGRGIP